MRTIAFIYGAIAGTITISIMIIGLILSGGKGSAASQTFGFLVMIVALSLIFFGIKRYRDRELGGVIRFGPAFIMGLAVAAVAGLFYVVIWEVYQAFTGYAFIDMYVANVLETKAVAGVSGADYEALVNKMDAMKTNYAKPYFRIPMTFMEILPVGVIIALISAVFLKKT